MAMDHVVYINRDGIAVHNNKVNEKI